MNIVRPQRWAWIVPLALPGVADWLVRVLGIDDRHDMAMLFLLGGAVGGFWYWAYPRTFVDRVFPIALLAAVWMVIFSVNGAFYGGVPRGDYYLVACWTGTACALVIVERRWPPRPTRGSTDPVVRDSESFRS